MIRKVLNKTETKKGAHMKNKTSKNRVIKKTNLAEKAECQGICPSCENFDLCSYIHSHIPREPVYFCEEFANQGVPAITKTSKTRETVTEFQAASGKYKGLCSTCENSNDCKFPKDEAGVWFCEQYR